MVTRCTSVPVVSVASRSSIGTNARFSRNSAPPICISAAPAGVSHRTVGRPEALVVAKALPGSFKSTKRFMSATRAPADSLANASLLRAVKKRTNSFWLCEHAAESTSRSAAVGPLAALGGVAGLSATRELDSCAVTCHVNSQDSVLRRRNLANIFCG